MSARNAIKRFSSSLGSLLESRRRGVSFAPFLAFPFSPPLVHFFISLTSDQSSGILTSNHRRITVIGDRTFPSSSSPSPPSSNSLGAPLSSSLEPSSNTDQREHPQQLHWLSASSLPCLPPLSPQRTGLCALLLSFAGASLTLLLRHTPTRPQNMSGYLRIVHRSGKSHRVEPDHRPQSNTGRGAVASLSVDLSIVLTCTLYSVVRFAQARDHRRRRFHFFLADSEDDHFSQPWLRLRDRRGHLRLSRLSRHNPHLVALSLDTLVDARAKNSYAPRLPVDLLPRLERLYLHTRSFRYPTSTLPPPSSDKILFHLSDCCPSVTPALLRQLAPRHATLEVWCWPRWDEACVTEACNAIEQALHLLKGPSKTLTSLSIPSEFRQSARLPLEVRLSFDVMVRLATQHGVDLRWAQGDVFEEFGRYLKARDSEEEDEGQRA
jgi:hypothetical protein